jgi:heat shock protein HslJ
MNPCRSPFTAAAVAGLVSLALSGCATVNAPTAAAPVSPPVSDAVTAPVATTASVAPAAAVNAAALTGRNWVLRSLPFSIADRGAGLRVAFVRFQPETGRLEGNTGCNYIRASFQADAAALRIRDIQGSSLPCTDGVTFEAMFIHALAETRRWAVREGRLVLSDAEGGELAVFEAGTP